MHGSKRGWRRNPVGLLARWGRRSLAVGQKYLGASPSQKSVQRIKDKIGDLLKPGEKGSWPSVRDRLNRLLAGWSAYFSYGTRELRNPRVGLSGRRSPCQRERSPLPRQTAQGARARRAPVFLE